MITKEVYMDIKAMQRNGKSIRAIAKELGLHRKTVREHLKSEDFPSYRKVKRLNSILAPFVQTIKDYLEENDYQATWIWDRLKNRGYSGSYDMVKRFVRTEKARKNRLAYARFETEPGQQAQCDWGDFQVEGSETVFAFKLVLGFSRADYTEFVDKRTMESFLDAHIRAFKYLGGCRPRSSTTI